MNKRDYIIAGLGALGGVIVGAGIGYFAARKSADIYYAEAAAEEIQKVKDHYRLLRKEDEVVPDHSEEIEEEPEQRAAYDEYVDYMNDLGYSGDPSGLKKMFDSNVVGDLAMEVAKKAVQEELDQSSMDTYHEEVEKLKQKPKVNIFDHLRPEEDERIEYEEAIRQREEGQPYVIHIDEYMDPDEDFKGHDRFNLVYFEGDDVLVDENNKVIPDVVRLLGEDALTQFGKFSKDKNVVYVRNETNQADFEVYREEGSWEERMFGSTGGGKVLKMREDD